MSTDAEGNMREYEQLKGYLALDPENTGLLADTILAALKAGEAGSARDLTDRLFALEGAPGP